MNDPNRKELATETQERPSPIVLADNDYGQKATIFEGGNKLQGREWVVGPETPTPAETQDTPWQFYEGKLYKIENWTDPKTAESQGQDILPGLYVKIKPVDLDDFENPSLVENIIHIFNVVVAKWAGEGGADTKYYPYPARYLTEERLLLLKVEPRNQQRPK